MNDHLEKKKRNIMMNMIKLRFLYLDIRLNYKYINFFDNFELLKKN